MSSAATMISAPSSTAEKYSALWCPNGWPRSGGCEPMRMAMSAATAVSTLTMLSSASENSATLPVIKKAMYLMPITASATPMLRGGDHQMLAAVGSRSASSSGVIKRLPLPRGKNLCAAGMRQWGFPHA